MLTTKTFLSMIDDERFAINASKEAVKNLDCAIREIVGDYGILKDKATQARYHNMKAEKETAHQDIKRRALKVKLLQHDYRIALYNEVMPQILNILKKYSGKAYGEKTKAKITEEVKQSCGVWFYIEGGANYRQCYHITNNHLSYNMSIEAYTKSNNEGVRPALLDNNKIVVPDIDNLMFWYDKYIVDIDKQIEDIKNAYNDALQAKKALSAACNTFNGLLPCNIEPIYPGSTLYDNDYNF